MASGSRLVGNFAQTTAAQSPTGYFFCERMDFSGINSFFKQYDHLPFTLDVGLVGNPFLNLGFSGGATALTHY